MSDDNTLIEVVTVDEELPTDVKSRILRICTISDDYMNKLEEVSRKLDNFISKYNTPAPKDDTQIINSVIDLKSKLTQIMLYISKIEEKIDSLPSDNEDMSVVRDDIESYANALSSEIISTRDFIAKRIEFSKPQENGKIDYVRDDIENYTNKISHDISATKEAIESKLSDLEKTVYNTVSDDIVVSADMKKTLNELSTRLFEVETSINNKVNEIKSFVKQNVESIDNNLTSVYTIRDVISKIGENIDVSADKMQNTSAQISEKLEILSSFTDNVSSVNDKINENIDSLNAVKKEISNMVTDINRKTDDTLNVVYSKVADLDYINTDLKNSTGAFGENVKNLEETKTKLEDNLNLIDDIRLNQKKTEKHLKGIVTKVGKNAKDFIKANTDIKKSTAVLKVIEKEYKKKETINKDLLTEVKKFNAHMSKMGHAEFYYKILEMKKRVKKYKRLPAWATEKKLRIINEIVIFENELNDLSIIYTLIKGDTSFTELKKVTGIGDKLLKSSLNRMITEQRIKKYKKGRFYLYTLSV